MRFDANPPTLKALNERLRLDPRVLRSVSPSPPSFLANGVEGRFTTLKVGSTLAAVTAPLEDPTVKYQRSRWDGKKDGFEEESGLSPIGRR